LVVLRFTHGWGVSHRQPGRDEECDRWSIRVGDDSVTEGQGYGSSGLADPSRLSV